MPDRCAVGGCSNYCDVNNVVILKYPSDSSLWSKWDAFMRSTRSWTKGNTATCVCSAHFEEDNFVNHMKWKMGFSNTLKLKTGAVPTIRPAKVCVKNFGAPKEKPENPNSKTVSAVCRRRTTRLKLDIAREQQNLNCPLNVDLEDEDNVEALQLQEDEHENGPGNQLQAEVPPATSSASKHVQVHIKLRGKHKYVSAIAEAKDVSVQCNLINAPPLKRNAGSTDESVGTDESVEKEERKGERQRAAAAEEDEPADEDGGEPEDPQFLNAPEPRPSPDLEDKYIVFQANLMQLFESCPRCSHPAKAFISKTVGSCIHVRQDCSNSKCCFFREWTSQPYIKQMPCGNLLLSSAVVLSGCSPTKILRLFYLLNVRYISESTFFRHQRHFIFPTVERKWKREQSELISQLQDEGRRLELIGDGRSDSPGHCAKYGTYTLIEQGLGKVLDIQIVQSNEVKNASWCELEGLQRSVGFLTGENNLTVNTLVTDRHPQINKWVRESAELEGVVHHFDSWHIIKSVRKKLDKVSSTKGCEEVGNWKRAILNHLWWTIGTTPDADYDMKVEKWKSVLFHIQGIHKDLPFQVFTDCAHGELEEDRLWLDPRSKPYTSLENVLGNKRLLQDVKRMSSAEQTSSLESFHSLILHFTPKHTAFSWLGMRTRQRLAALHFNENSRREQAKTADGQERYTVVYSKAKNFECRVRPVPRKHTVRYAIDIQHELMELYRTDRVNLKQSLSETAAQQPPPLADKAQRREKADAVRDHITRLPNFH